MFNTKLTKLVVILLLVALMCTLLVGCNAKNDYAYAPEYGGNKDESNTSGSGDIDVPSGGITSVTNRKVIYYISMSMESDDITSLHSSILEELGSDGWADITKINQNDIYLELRVKTDLLDSFIENISEGNSVSSYSKTASDVSDEYFDISSRINTLEVEQTQLLKLLEKDSNSLSETMAITTRLAEIQGKLDVLQGELNGYDSLIEYSTVTINLYGNGKTPANIKFGDKLGKTFGDAWSAVGDMFETIAIGIVAVFPFALVLAPVVVGLVFLVKYLDKRKLVKKNDDATKPNNNATLLENNTKTNDNQADQTQNNETNV